MTPTPQFTNIVFGFIKKMFTYENGALVLIATPFSGLLKSLFEILFAGIEPKVYAMPFVVAATCIILYFLVFSMDFYTGLRASRFEAKNNKNYIKSDKLWSSIWKISTIYLMVFALAIFSLIFAVLHIGLFYNIFIYSIVVISLMAILFDLHSIGENHKRRFGKKPKIFNWLDNITKAINELVIGKIKNLI